MANVAGYDLFLLQGLRDTKRVVDHRLLYRVHLRKGKHVKMYFLCNRSDEVSPSFRLTYYQHS